MHIHDYVEAKILNMKLLNVCTKKVLKFPTENTRAHQGANEGDEAS